MGMTPAKSFAPPVPYGTSQGNVVNQAQGPTMNQQTPLLPPNFYDPGSMSSSSTPLKSMTGVKSPLQNQPNPWKALLP